MLREVLGSSLIFAEFFLSGIFQVFVVDTKVLIGPYIKFDIDVLYRIDHRPHHQDPVEGLVAHSHVDSRCFNRR